MPSLVESTTCPLSAGRTGEPCHGRVPRSVRGRVQRGPGRQRGPLRWRHPLPQATGHPERAEYVHTRLVVRTSHPKAMAQRFALSDTAHVFVRMRSVKNVSVCFEARG